MPLNFSTDVMGGGTSGPLEPSYDNVMRFFAIVLFAIVVIAVVVAIIVKWCRDIQRRNIESKNKPKRINLSSAEALKREDQSYSEEFTLTEAEKELIREYREKENNKED